MAAERASDIPLELIGHVTPLPADGGPVPGEIIVHQAHAVGHAAVLLADRGVLLAGDMLSDVLIPLLDSRQTDQVGAWQSRPIDPGADGPGRAGSPPGAWILVCLVAPAPPGKAGRGSRTDALGLNVDLPFLMI
jgi:hypothetical protein